MTALIYDRKGLTISDGVQEYLVTERERSILNALTEDPGRVILAWDVADKAGIEGDWALASALTKLRKKLRKMFGAEAKQIENHLRRWSWQGGVAVPKILIGGANLKLATCAAVEADLLAKGYARRWHGRSGDRHLTLYVNGWSNWTMLARLKSHPETDVAVVGQGDFSTLTS